MKRLAGRWKIGVVVVVAALALWFYLGSDPSIHITDTFQTVHGRSIENGEAYDRATLYLEKCETVVLPDTAGIRREGEGNELQVFMKKSMSFYGHPPEPMSIRTARKNMGCAVKKGGGALVLATFGEWFSKEGGARMGVEVHVPKQVEVKKRPGLSGSDSAGREWGGAYLTKPKDAKEGWYGPASPAEGWKAIPDVPDPKRRAAGTNYPSPPPPVVPVIPRLPRAVPEDPPA